MTTRCLALVPVVLLLAGSGLDGQSAPPSAARAALDEASTALRKGDFQQALPLAERAVALAEQADDQLTLARALAELGRTQWGRGQYAVAFDTLERSLGIFRALDDATGMSDVLMRQGETEFSRGRYQEALAKYALALDANRRTPVKALEARIQTNVGVALRFLGRLDEADETTRGALEIFRQSGDTGGAGQALTFLGIINRARGEYQRAIDAYTEAVTIRQQLGDRRGQAQVLGNLGNVYMDLSEWEKAIDAYQRSLAIAEDVGYAAQVGFSRTNLAVVLGELGREAEALARFEEALDIWRQMDRQPEVGRTLRHVGLRRFLGRGDVPGARAAFDEALAIAQRLGDRELEALTALDIGGLDLAQADVPRALQRFDEVLAMARAITSPDLEYKVLAQRGRARLRAGNRDAAIEDLQASAAIVNDLRSRVSSDDAKIAFTDTRQTVFQDLATALLDAGRPIDALEVAEAARARALVDALDARRSGPETGDSPAASAAIDEIRAVARTRNAVVVEYLQTERELLAWVITPQGDVQVARTPLTLAEVNGLVRRLIDAFDDPRVLDGSATPVHTLLRDLHRVVIAPVARWLPASPSQPILIVPSGVLAYVPFAALEDARGTPLVARHSLSVAPSLSMLRYTALGRRRPADGKRAIIVSAPEAPREVDLRPLSGSVDEGRRVASRLASFTPTLLSGSAATERTLKQTAAQATFLHFATHGLVSDTRPANSSLVLAGGDGEDGYLRAREVYDLRLTADLVVLSGCSTARGRITGDGVFGLPRAFLYAGAPSVVASLWDISDRATVYLMDRFYAELLRTQDKAAALRTAQLETRTRYPHPALWAPFVLVGEVR